MENNNIIVQGNYNLIIIKLKEYIVADEEIKELLLFLENNTNILDTTCESFKEIDYMPSYTKTFIIPETNYYLNLKTFTIFFVASLLDLKLTKSFTALALALYGVNSRAFVKLNEQEAEKCILIETIKKADKKGDKYILSNNKKECINNDFACKYRYCNKCNITYENIIEIYDNLTAKNVFTKVGDTFEYNF